MKTVIATVKTYEPDIASRGYHVDIRDDATMRITSRTCWQGSRTGEAWIVRAPDAIMQAANGNVGDDDPDLETLVNEYIASYDFLERGRRIRLGHIVR